MVALAQHQDLRGVGVLPGGFCAHTQQKKATSGRSVSCAVPAAGADGWGGWVSLTSSAQEALVELMV